MNDRQFKKRRKYLIDKKFQLRYAANTLIFIMIAFFIFTAVFYQVGFVPLLEKLKNVYPEARLFIILKGVYKNLVIAFLFLLTVTFAFAVFRSHKIAGPLFRLKGHIHRMSNGDFLNRVKLRKKDELIVLADELNLLSRNISLLIEEANGLTQRMQLATNELRNKIKTKPGEHASLAETLSRLETEIEQFREILKQYKI